MSDERGSRREQFDTYVFALAGITLQITVVIIRAAVTFAVNRDILAVVVAANNGRLAACLRRARARAGDRV